MAELACAYRIWPEKDFIFIISPARYRERRQPDVQRGGPGINYGPSKETMDNSLLAASVHGAGRQRVVFTVEPA